MTVAAFDTLAAAEALQNAGIEPKRAKAIVAIARDAAGAGRDELATKADLAELKAATKADLAGLRADLVDRMAALETRLTWRMVGIMAALLAAQGALIVALLQPAAS